MSTRQLKKMLIWAEPRLVAERTETAPGMSFIASSMGRVTVAIISSAGMMPLSTRMTTRGKSVCGNTDDGIRSAEKTPARHSATAMNVMDSACRVANRPRGGGGSHGNRNQSGCLRYWRYGEGIANSALHLSLGFFVTPIAIAVHATIRHVIFVFSGNP